jgi:flavin reductase (DIM6/NTAB) family NADH-FMN oxidoreductase RutF
MAVSKDDFKQVMGSFAAGVTVVSTVDADGIKWGLTATAFTSVSLEPPLCLVCVDKRAGSLAAFHASKTFAVSMLSSEQVELSNRFASRIEDKFEGVAHAPGAETGCPILEGVIASMECTLEHAYAGGDHDILVGRLVATAVDGTANPLLHWRGRYADIEVRP